MITNNDNCTKHTSMRSAGQHASSVEEASIATTVVAMQGKPRNNVANSDIEKNHNHVPPPFSRDVSVSFPTLSAATIPLSAQEEQLFRTLLSAADAYQRGDIHLPDSDNNKNNNNSNIEIRVAGGWVRDKLLNLHSQDVDIAVDTLSGVDFAKLVQTYLKTTQSQIMCGRIGVISANPSQSKHLETATMVIHQLEVDFTNLRSQEVYESHSRIPTTTTPCFGTPLEDAERRDFTINALYFNLRTRQVEDWTRRGLVDLQSGLMLTPLDPQVTFYDDPLRVLRAIRFAVRYNFTLDQSLRNACMSTNIHNALIIKVSRERVGKELEGMISGKGARPNTALDTIASLKLAGSIFLFPTDNNTVVKGTITTIRTSTVTLSDPTESIGGNTGSTNCNNRNSTAYTGTHDQLLYLRELAWEESRILLRTLHDVRKAHIMETAPLAGTKNIYTSLDDRLLHIASFLMPFRHLYFTDRKNKEHTVVSYMMREGIKFKNVDVKRISSLMEHVDNMKTFLTETALDHPNYEYNKCDDRENNNVKRIQICRLQAGLLLWSTRDLWTTCLLLATVLKMRETEYTQASMSCGLTARQDFASLSQGMYRRIVDMGLDHCWKATYLLDGKALISELGLPKGPIVGNYLDEQKKWMLLNPQGSKEECAVHLKSCKRELEQSPEDSSSQNQVVIGVDIGGKSNNNGVGRSSPILANSRETPLSKRMHVETVTATTSGSEISMDLTLHASSS